MEKAKVYFTDLRTSPTSNLLNKMERLVKKAGIAQLPLKDSFVAIKIHFGEPGNLAYIRPNYAYSGRRSNAVDHLESAMENGFNPISAQCQVIIADGLKGTEYREIPIDGQYCKAPKIGAAIADADIVISMTHFKGHEQAGFGGALKNLGMGSAAVPGKLELHASAQPKIETENCIGCNICVKHCAHDARCRQLGHLGKHELQDCRVHQSRTEGQTSLSHQLRDECLSRMRLLEPQRRSYYPRPGYLGLYRSCSIRPGMCRFGKQYPRAAQQQRTGQQTRT